ncbi:hypothetical protein ACFY9A_12560 [Streptomyces rubradiris]|uniref:hypothetical protein n=1 Tax=Streptomyces rubradiris TaxID=285531 RepID=UPI0036E413CF
MTDMPPHFPKFKRKRDGKTYWFTFSPFPVLLIKSVYGDRAADMKERLEAPTLPELAELAQEQVKLYGHLVQGREL